MMDFFPFLSKSTKLYLREFIDRNPCIFSILACNVLTFIYVSSLYVWRSTLSRDHPTTIKRRFFSVFCMMLLAPLFPLYFLTEDTLSRGDFLEQFGLRVPGLIKASILPFLLTVILFLGPLTMQFYSGVFKIYSGTGPLTMQFNSGVSKVCSGKEPMYWSQIWYDLIWLRNHIIAPLSEEWVFRSCMMPLLLQCFKPLTAVFVGPLLFGIAHFHHMYEQIKAGLEFKTALFLSLFQFTYTTLFGFYSAYLFVSTGHVIAPLMAHIFCNHMGFPNFGEVGAYPMPQRGIIIFNFLLGFVLWCIMLSPMTSPDIYDNGLHWET